jgi:hypothetical protein
MEDIVEGKAVIAEGNNLIAQFMPNMVWHVPPNLAYTPYWRQFDESGFVRKDYVARRSDASNEERFISLGYHNDWNRLMQVVAHIESLGFSVFIQNDACWVKGARLGKEYRCGVSVLSDNGKMAAVWELCILFIKWYNTKH